MKKNLCACGPMNFLWLVLSAAVLSVGVVLLVQGISMQWAGAVKAEVFIWDACGLLVLMIGKYFRTKAGEGCEVHN